MRILPSSAYVPSILFHSKLAKFNELAVTTTFCVGVATQSTQFHLLITYNLTVDKVKATKKMTICRIGN